MKIPENAKVIVNKMIDCFCKAPLYESITLSYLCAQCLTAEELRDADRHLCYFQYFFKELKQRKIKHKILSSGSVPMAEGLPQYVIQFYRYEGRKIKNPDWLHRIELADQTLDEILEAYPQTSAIYYNGRNFIIMNGADVLFVNLGSLEVVEALPAYSKDAEKKFKAMMLVWPDDVNDQDRRNPFIHLTVHDMVMIKINEMPGISQKELTAEVDGGIHDSSTIHQALKKLMAEGSIKRRGNPPYRYFPSDFGNDKWGDGPTYIY